MSELAERIIDRAGAGRRACEVPEGRDDDQLTPPAADVQPGRAAHPVPVREAVGRAAGLAVRATAGSRSSRRVRCTARATPATCFYVLIEGTIALSRRVGADDVETTRTSSPGSTPAPGGRTWASGRRRPTTTRCGRSSRPGSSCWTPPLFAKAMRDWFPMAVHMLEGLFYGMQSTNDAVNQRERLLALGSLSAGLTHELNNPASAAVRATAALRERVAGMRHKLGDHRVGQEASDRVRAAGRAAGGGRGAGRQGPHADPDRGRRRRGRDRRVVGGARDPRRLEHRTDVRAGRHRRALAGEGLRHRSGRHPGRRAQVALLHGRDRAADERDPATPPRGSPPWSARPSSTRSWTAPRSRPWTCTSCWTAR